MCNNTILSTDFAPRPKPRQQAQQFPMQQLTKYNDVPFCYQPTATPMVPPHIENVMTHPAPDDINVTQ